MSLQGQRIGPYDILDLIGEGGMGQVYRANDTVLNRDVAVKFLPDQFGTDSDRLARFQREAQALAALNHPNIATIHGLEQSDSMRALVMELVEGPTLADRIAQGPIPVEEALNIAKQVAEALEYAHERGIIHRDLKPANIKITPGGQVKILDFGLAKAMGSDTPAANISNSPTISLAATQAGIILGTAAYMSPEQAKGKPVDRRTDIWAFGVVVYEMMTGRRLFSADDVTETIAQVVMKEPDWNALPVGVPPGIRKLLRLCLEKDVKKRRRDAGDVRIDIEEALREPKEVAAQPAATLPWRRRLSWIAAGIFVLAIAAMVPVAIIRFREAVTADQSIRFVITAPENATVLGAPPAISPDGKRVAFVVTSGGKTQLWIRPLNSVIAQPLPGTDNADYPFWSPDSRSIAFADGSKLKKIDISGGPAQTLCDIPAPMRGGAWNNDGVIVFGVAVGGLYRVSSSGGAAVILTTLEAGETSHRGPSFLPDGHHFLFYENGKRVIYISSLDNAKDRKVLRNSLSTGAYATSAYVLFSQEGTLMAQHLDVDQLQLTGDAFPVAEHVGMYNGTSSAFSVSSVGTIAYSFGSTAGRQLSWLDRAGKVGKKVGPFMTYADIALSPDEKRAAVQLQDNDLWMVDLIRGIPSRFTFNTVIEDYPVWSPDGSRVLFNFNPSGAVDIYSKAASGAGAEELVFKSSTTKNPWDWSRDGRFILYEDFSPETKSDLWVLPLSGDKKPQLFLRTPFAETMGRFSPDGKWIAYVSDESGYSQVYVQPFPPSGGKWQISTKGGFTPRWRGDGKELFYLSPERELMSVDVNSAGATFEVSSPKTLFQTQVDTASISNRYDVSRDGQRFLMSLPAENTVSPPITVITNWLGGTQRER
jgi:eukaryotic-like serine/threonine-protein kinase